MPPLAPTKPLARNLFRDLYDWMMVQAGKPYAIWFLALIAFAESSVFPIPPDVLLVPMVLAARHRAWRIALVCTLASVAGGYAGYLIGALLFDALAQPILDFYGYAEKFESLRALYNEHGFWIVFTAGLSPIPYKVFTIFSGVTGFDPALFGLGSVTSRGLRFFLLCALLYYFGAPIRRFIDNNFGWLTLAFCVLLIGGVALLKLV